MPDDDAARISHAKRIAVQYKVPALDHERPHRCAQEEEANVAFVGSGPEADDNAVATIDPKTRDSWHFDAERFGFAP